MNRSLAKMRSMRHPERGFTILELLIATIVFSVVLLVVTVGILQISRVYYKGINETNTQNTARNIIDTISQSIQFSGGQVTTTPGTSPVGTNLFVCIGNRQFSYQLGKQVENNPNTSRNQEWHALTERNLGGCSSSSPVDTLDTSSIQGRDLVGLHMRLANLVVSNVGTNQYQVLVRVVYGDDDLINNPTGTNASCKGETRGSQFCSVSEFSTIVVKRVE